MAAARRQSSTTSLSRYARMASPDLSNRSLDFCNAFWGPADGGVDVLLARMRGASRTMEELRSFWKERASIEEEYAKRLSKLAKQALGKDEIGELRNTLDTLRLETDRQASAHMLLCQQLKNELETPAGAFISRQQQFKRDAQGRIEKMFKQKQTQESYVTKAKEKYENDCMRINSYVAQSSLVQGKDLERLQLKLEKAKMTVVSNERDFLNFTKALQETIAKWEKDWKYYCDGCQDMEEERIEFMKDNIWAYANAVSTVCVADDESCEKIRVSLEQLEPERDMENFVRDYGTGNEIPEPPRFISYSSPDAMRQAAQVQPPRYAHYNRVTQRVMTMAQAMAGNGRREEEDPVDAGQAGRGAGGAGLDRLVNAGAGGAVGAPSQSRPASRAASRAGSRAGGANGMGDGGVASHNASPTTATHVESGISGPSGTSGISSPATMNAPPLRPQPLQAQPVQPPQPIPTTQQQPITQTPLGPAHKTMLQIGDNAYEVDPEKDPQQQGKKGPSITSVANVGPTAVVMSTGAGALAGVSGAGIAGNSGTASGIKSVGDESDPLAKQMESLRASAVGAVRRLSVNASGPGGIASPTNTTTPVTTGMVAGAKSPIRSPIDLAQSQIRGHTPTGSTSSNLAAPAPSSSTPQPQTPIRDYRNSAELVVGGYPPSTSRPSSPNPPTATFMQPPNSKPSSPLPVEQVVAGYEQSFPGERKSVSRASSRQGYHATTGSVSSQNQNRMSMLERPVSREGYAGIGARRSPSPQPITGPPGGVGGIYGSQQGHGHSMSQMQARAPSPGNLDIALDASGQVARDGMAERYIQQQQQEAHAQAQVQQGYGVPQRGASVRMSMAGPPPPVQQQQQQQYGSQQYMPTGGYAQVPPPPIQTQNPTGQPPPPPQSASAVTPHHQHQNSGSYYNTYAPPPVQQPPPQQQQQQPVYQPPPPVSPQAQPQQTGMGMNMYGQPNGYYGQAQQQQQLTGANGVPVQNGYGSGGYMGYGQQQQQQQPQQGAGYGHASIPVRDPSPAPPPPQGQQMTSPTGQRTEDGRPVLFYVKALYDYQATIDEEFDFQTGDVIAVTSTPEDGWWTGELLDENRRIPGKTVFPSNFVCLF